LSSRDSLDDPAYQPIKQLRMGITTNGKTL
jgi:hypothetical protein